MSTIKKGALGALYLVMFAFGLAPRAQAAYTDDCITFSSAASFTLKIGSARKNWDGTLWTSTDKTNWAVWEGGEVTAAQTGGTYNLYVRGNTSNTKIAGNKSNYRWVLTGSNIACTGNIETLRGATGNDPSPTKMANYCYGYMFYGCEVLTSAPALPATTLANYGYCYTFYGCTALSSAPSLPSTTLASQCYQYMFFGCTSLTTAPVLPATTLANYCYDRMFGNCKSLTTAPELPATTLAQSCYSLMFSGCTSLKDAPALPATTLADSCYAHMFYNCTALKEAPALPAMTLAAQCYLYMFYGCTALTAAPTLPATILANECYSFMFRGCTSLTVAPALPATTLETECYCGMFEYCTALEVNEKGPGKEWKIPATGTTVEDWGKEMFAKTKGTLKGQPDLNTAYYIRSAVTIIDDCITFSSAATFTLKTRNGAKNWDGKLRTSTDRVHWTEWNGEEVSAAQLGGTSSYILHVYGDTNNTVIAGCESDEIGSWVLDGSGIACSGNIETLRGATGDQPSPTKMADRCYDSMFLNCTALTAAPALPATTLAKECYRLMFCDCTALTNAPALPATTLADWCYNSMFSHCTSLKDAPALPATELKNGCYGSIFSRCTALTEAPELPATALANWCYSSMFRNCTALTEAPALPATTLANKCYYAMFRGCTSLKHAPELPATELAEECYSSMFYGCTALEVNEEGPGKEWKVPATSTTATDWGKEMFKDTKGTLQGEPALNTVYYVKSAQEPTDDCITFSSAATFALKTSTGAKNWDGKLWTSTDKVYWMLWKGAAVTAAQTGGTGNYNLYVRGNADNTKITSGGEWVLDGSGIACSGNAETLRGATGDAPSPTKMADSCYSYMFYGCTALTKAPALPATTLADGCYEFMFRNCASLTEAPALPATELSEKCYYGMFAGCTALTEAPALPATTLAEKCYSSMLEGCSSLTKAPALPATELANGCYAWMFSDCTSLVVNAMAPGREWKIPATSTTATDWGTKMFAGSGGMLQEEPALNTTYYVNSAREPTDDYITFSSAATFTLKTHNGAKNWDGTLCISTDKTNWTVWEGGEVSAAQTGGTGNYNLYVLGNADNTKITSGCQWVLGGSGISCSGNIETLRGATGNSPSPTPMADSCYAAMFHGCTALTKAPALPATELANGCYTYMFYGCTSLAVNEEGPGKEWKIPAASTTAGDWGGDMFTGTSGTLQGQPALNTTYYIANAPQPIEPGGKIVVPEGKAEAKAAEINGNPTVKAQYLKAPEGVVTTADYLGCFDAVATSGSTVAFVLNEKGTNAVVEATEAVNTATLGTVFSEESTMTIDNPLVGFYYSFKQGGDVSVGDQADLNKLGGRDAISFELTKGPLKYFYQTLVTPTALPAE